jgi:hypothetical protein
VINIDERRVPSEKSPDRLLASLLFRRLSRILKRSSYSCYQRISFAAELYDQEVFPSYSTVLPNSAPFASNLIENELLDAFNRLHTHAVTVIGDSCTFETHNLEQANGDRVLENMPKVFSDFEELHQYFIHFMKRCAVIVQVCEFSGTVPCFDSPASSLHSICL